MKQRNVFLFLISIFATFCTNAYEFKGTHYTAQMYGCDHTAVSKWIYVYSYFVRGCDASGATVIRAIPHVFENGSVTAVALLSESHASIHTYPEFDCVFVDLFTCGDDCDYREFEKIIVEWLKPTKVRRRVWVRK